MIDKLKFYVQSEDLYSAAKPCADLLHSWTIPSPEFVQILNVRKEVVPQSRRWPRKDLCSAISTCRSLACCGIRALS